MSRTSNLVVSNFYRGATQFLETKVPNKLNGFSFVLRTIHSKMNLYADATAKVLRKILPYRLL